MWQRPCIIGENSATRRFLSDDTVVILRSEGEVMLKITHHLGSRDNANIGRNR